MTVELFRKRPTTVQVVRWWRDGDDPDVRPYRSEHVSPLTVCTDCSKPINEHGWYGRSIQNGSSFGGFLVHPGSYLVRQGDGLAILSQAEFVAEYERAPEPMELSEVERAAMDTSLHASTCHRAECPECLELLMQVRRILTAAGPLIRQEAADEEYSRLHRQGRVLPEGVERRERYELVWDYEPGFEPAPVTDFNLPSEALKTLREQAQNPPKHVTGGRIVFREHWAGPWTDVEAVEVQKP